MKFLQQLLFLIVLMPVMANAAAPTLPEGEQVTGTIALQGGSDSAVKWVAPSTTTYKVHVLVPKAGKVTNALYRVYPKGKRAGDPTCNSNDTKYPCTEVSVDQTQHADQWVQLMLNENKATQWKFTKGIGYVTAVASNLSAAELLNLSALMRFADTSLMPTFLTTFLAKPETNTQIVDGTLARAAWTPVNTDPSMYANIGNSYWITALTPPGISWLLVAVKASAIASVTPKIAMSIPYTLFAYGILSTPEGSLATPVQRVGSDGVVHPAASNLLNVTSVADALHITYHGTDYVVFGMSFVGPEYGNIFQLTVLIK